MFWGFSVLKIDGVFLSKCFRVNNVRAAIQVANDKPAWRLECRERADQADLPEHAGAIPNARRAEQVEGEETRRKARHGKKVGR